MAISKIGSKALVDCSVAAVDIEDNSITSAKLAGSIANAKLANSSITVNGTSVSLGASGSIPAVSWQSVITADGSTGTTAVAGNGYFIDTTSAAHTITLPSSPSIGDTVAIKDYAGTFGSNNLTIARNSSNIQGVANDSLISTNRASLTLVYVDATKGWLYAVESNVADLEAPTFISATGGTVTESGDFKIHTFTGDGCFVISCAGNQPGTSDKVDYLVVAGGGSGGNSSAGGGGGGAGGYRTTFPSPDCNAGSFPISVTTYPITVGGGGASLPAGAGLGNSGSNSIFSTITSTGGGGGGGPNGGGCFALPGGSGGANGGYNSPCTAGTGNTPPVSPPQGNNGGLGNTCTAGAGTDSGGGGGGAGGTGNNGVLNDAGNGGSGATSSINGTPTARAGGGGGGININAPSPGRGSGAAGGGNGGERAVSNATSATANTGSGGGGGGSCSSISGAGGSGIVIIRYKFQ
jgi:hypothetical protein